MRQANDFGFNASGSNIHRLLSRCTANGSNVNGSNVNAFHVNASIVTGANANGFRIREVFTVDTFQDTVSFGEYPVVPRQAQAMVKPRRMRQNIPFETCIGLDSVSAIIVVMATPCQPLPTNRGDMLVISTA